jgi:DNA replication protein DnaC
MGEIFKDHVIAAALLARILHHCTTINLKGGKSQAERKEKTGYKNRTYTS